MVHRAFAAPKALTMAKAPIVARAAAGWHGQLVAEPGAGEKKWKM
jgi:hypothetical protein